MFFVRINKIKVFDNREKGFLGLFDRAEMRIYGYAVGSTGLGASGIYRSSGSEAGLLTLGDLAGLPDDNARKEKLLSAVIAEADRFSHSVFLEIDRVKDNQTLTFGDAGILLFQSDKIPDFLDIQLWVIESDSDVRNFAVEADKVLDSDAFKALFGAVGTALAAVNPVLTAVIGLGGVLTNMLRKRLRANKDDLVGYMQCSLNREEHYPHGVRDKENVPDTTGNIMVDYTIFGIKPLPLPPPHKGGDGQNGD